MKVGKDLIERTNQIIIEKLDGYLRPTPFITISRYLINDRLINLADMSALSAFMHTILEVYPQLNSVYLSDTQGNTFIETHVTNKGEQSTAPFSNILHIPAQTNFLSEMAIHKDKSTLLTANYKNENDILISEEKNIPVSYDPLTRPWYIGAKNLTNHYWIGVYQFYSTKKPGITISFPIWINNKLAGVAAADLSVDLITQQLKNFSLSNRGTVFIINRHGEIISYEKDFNTQQIHDRLPRLSDINNPLINEAYNLHQKIGKRSFNFEFKGVSYIANFTPYAFSKEETWEIATILPIDVFVGAIKRTDQQTLIFSLIMLLIGLMLVIIFAHTISRPIMRLADETKEIVKLQFDKKIPIKTHIYEVQVMIDALRATKSALSSFAKYVPKTLVEQLLQTRTIAEVGGQKKEITVLFSDIANFTEAAEKTAAETLMIHISEYLNSLTHIIQQNKGNIDKYIGDAIMAFWGAPIEDPDHIANACQATLACRKQVEIMNAEWLQAGKSLFPTRFGLHSGIAIVGNMGSSDRLNYTAIGDTVNLAARLETINKIYHTEIVVSQAIYEKCANQFLFRPLDIVQVKGKLQPTAIYELVAGKEGSVDFPPTSQQIELCELSRKAFLTYQQQDFNHAMDLFKKILALFPEDGMAKIYIHRCEEHLNAGKL